MLKDCSLSRWCARFIDRRAAGRLASAVFAVSLCISEDVRAEPTDWAALVGGVSNEIGYAVATDVDGSVILAGSFEGTTRVGNSQPTSRGNSDVFVAKFAGGGDAVWVRQLGGWSTDQPAAVAVDAQSGDVVVVGAYSGALSADTQTVPGFGATDVFVSRLSQDGQVKWTLAFGGRADDVPGGVVVDGNGDSLVAGEFTGTFSCGPTALESAGGVDIFVAKVSNAGVLRWCRRYGGVSDDIVAGIAVSDAGVFALAGAFSTETDLGGGTLPSAGLFDAFVATYADDGDLRWARRLGGTGYDGGSALSFDAAGALLVTGYFGLFGDAVNFGGGAVASHGGADAFVAKYKASDGSYLWSNSFGGERDDYANALGVDPWGNVVIAGEFQGSVAFAGTSASAKGQFDAFVARLSPEGLPIWWQRYGDLINDKAHGVAIDFDGNSYITGFSLFRIDLGEGLLHSAGMSDAFLLKLAPPVDARPTPTHTPTHTRVPPTATATVVPPTRTFTAIPPTPTLTAVLPTATWTRVPATPTLTDTPVPATPTFSRPPASTATRAAPPAPMMCTVDCDNDGTVTVDELVIGINIVLGRAPLDTCNSSDANDDGAVMINEVVSAIRSALAGCL